MIPDGLSDGDPVGGLQVGAVQIEQLQRLHLAQAGDFRDAVQKLPGAELGHQPLGGGLGRDGAAGGEKQNAFHRLSSPNE